MGNPKASDEELWAVLGRVNLLGFLKGEKGLDTKLNEKASNLSGGQCQRLGLARAFLHNSNMLLLDEPTSNLDSLNEAVILKSLKEEKENKTVVLVSHRKSTMCIAQRVYSVEHGRVS